MRKFIAGLCVVGALAVPAVAQAGDRDYPPPFPTPLPSSVTDEASANTFARAYVLRNAGSIARVNLGDNRGRFQRSTVSDVASACLQHPVVAARFGCIVRFNINIRDNDRRGDRFSRSSVRRGGHDGDDWDRRNRSRDRDRSLGCLAALRISGGPSVTPSVTVAFADCVNRPRAYPR